MIFRRVAGSALPVPRISDGTHRGVDVVVAPVVSDLYYVFWTCRISAAMSVAVAGTPSPRKPPPEPRPPSSWPSFDQPFALAGPPSRSPLPALVQSGLLGGGMARSSLSTPSRLHLQPSHRGRDGCGAQWPRVLRSAHFATVLCDCAE